MQDISILIPTAKRPHFLLTALASVARQTILSRVGEIIVIENGEDRRSEETCCKFPNLPIRYIYREPPIPPSERTVSVLREAKLPFVAMLHDDDWWFEFHLERSIQDLEKKPSLAAVYSSHFITQSETDHFRGIRGNHGAWFGNEKSIDGVTRTLNFTQMITTNIVQSEFHMSSLVYRNKVIEACFGAFAGHEFDTDRTLAVELSRQGDVFFHDTPSIVVRRHPGQESHPNSHSEAQAWFDKNTRRMIKQARDCAIDLPAELKHRFSHPQFDFTTALSYISINTLEILAAESLLPPSILAHLQNLTNVSAEPDKKSKTIKELKQTVDSAIQWQRRPWFVRALHRWRPPSAMGEKLGFFARHKRSLMKRVSIALRPEKSSLR